VTVFPFAFWIKCPDARILPSRSRKTRAGMPLASKDVLQKLHNQTVALELEAGEGKPKTAVYGA
jgi:hypothetical protein